MTTTDAVAQAESCATYRLAARRFGRLALVEHQSGHPLASRIALRIAHHASIEEHRNRRGDRPDEWERP